MAGRLINRFRVLLAEKAEGEQRNISLKEVERQTGIAWSSLHSWANNKVTRYDENVIIALCDYFDCEIDDLLVYKRE